MALDILLPTVPAKRTLEELVVLLLCIGETVAVGYTGLHSMCEALVDCTVLAAELLRLCRSFVRRASADAVRGAIARNPPTSAIDPIYLLAEAFVDERLANHEST